MKKKYIMGSDERSTGLLMRIQKLLVLLLFVFFGVSNVRGQVTVSGAVTGNGPYTTLGAAFTAIGTSQTGANIIVDISGDTNETAMASLGAGDWASVIIKPSGGAWTVSGALATELIQLNGADNVTINGLNTGGNALTISNTSTANTAGTIKFQNDATNNTITNCSVLGSTTVSVNTTTTPGGVIFFGTAGTGNGNDGNTISNCKITAAGINLPSKLIGSIGSTTSVAAANSGNTITNCELYDYFVANANSAAIYLALGNTDWTITNNKIYQTAARTFTAAGILYGIVFGNATSGDNVQITGNTIGYNNNAGTGTMILNGATVAGEFQGVYFNASTTAATACNINNNTISDISLTSSTGRFFGIYNGAGASSNTININGNTIRNISAQTTTNTVNPIYAGAATTLSCSNNTITGITKNGTGALYGINYGAPTNMTVNSNEITNLSVTSAGNTAAFSGIQTGTAATETINGNTITNLTSSATGAQVFCGINLNGGAGNKTVQNNTLSNFTFPAASTGTMHGIRMAAGGALNVISGNTVSSFAGPNSGGANGVNGITMSAGTTTNVYKNKVYGLNGPGASSQVIGFVITAGGTYNIYNNIIGDLTAPLATGTGEPHYVIGINCYGPAMNLYNNTIVLNGTNSGANFGSSALYSPGPLTLRNNIMINNLPANGIGVSVVLRLAGGIGNYGATSDNNLFSGTAIHTKTGTTDLDVTLNAFKARTGNRDLSSVTENPSFVSTTGSDATYLHINTTVPTQIESGGVNIATVTEDFDGDMRNGTTPDIGADEFTGIALDLSGPIITHTPSVVCAAGSRTISATITDFNGVPTAGAGLPVAYWRINNGAYTAAVGTSMGSGVYNFTVGAGSVTGDIVNYYFVAQDLVSTPNVSVYPSVGAAGFSANPPAVTTSPMAPLSLLIPMTGVYTVGVAGNYPTLTAAVSDYNVRCLAGPVTFSLLDAAYASSETFPITIQQNADASAVNTLTIRPASGVMATVSGTSTAILKLDGADYVTIDGLNVGGSGLTVSNANTANTAGVSTIEFRNDAINNTITNCSLQGSGTANTGTDGGVVYFGTGTTTGNDGNTISNCNIGPAGANLPVKLIYSKGVNTSEDVCNSGITVTGCNLYDFFIANNNSAAVYVTTGNSAWNITNNKIYQTATRTFTSGYIMYGVYFSNSVHGNNVQITGNTIGYLNSAGTGTLTLTGTVPCGFRGIYYITSPTAANACNINNNTIANVSLTSSISDIYGIFSDATANTNTINIKENTIRNLTALNTTGIVCGIWAGGASTLICSNNVIDNLTRNTAGHLYGINYKISTTATFDSNTISNLSYTGTTGSAKDFYGIYSNVATPTEAFTNNTLSNFSSAMTAAHTIIGISNGSSNGGNKTFQNNTISNFSVNATGTGSNIGIRMNTGGSINEISGNKIHTFTGGGNVNGIVVPSGTTNNIYKNKIYGLSTTATNAAVYGMAFSGGTNNVYNNFIGNLTAPAASGPAGYNQVVGINATNSTAALNLYHNTVVISGTSSGANFGTSVISTGGTPVLTMNNNILVNTATPMGTGLSVTFRRPALTGYSATSNNNLFYGTAIYTDGTNTDATLDAFRTRLGDSRDGLSVSENPNFLSNTGADANYLHINPAVPTQIENGGAPIAMVTDDFDGDIRNATTPDIGADEFAPLCSAAVGGTSVPTAVTLCVSGNTMISASGYTVGNGITYQWESASDAAFTTPVNEGTSSAIYANLTTPTITATTFYRLKVTCSAGMSGYSTVSTVTVNPSVTPTFVQVAPICSGSTLSPLPTTSENGITGTWLPVLNNTTTTTYTFTPDVGQCGTTTTMEIVVNTTPAPTGQGTQTISVGSSADATIEDLTPNGADIAWYPTAADAMAGTNAILAGTQLVSGEDYFAMQTVAGCRSTTYLAVTVTVTLGVNDFSLGNLKVYPNPVYDILNVESGQTISAVEIYSITGQRVMVKSVNTMSASIDMSALAGGTYLVKVVADDAVKAVKVIKN